MDDGLTTLTGRDHRSDLRHRRRPVRVRAVHGRGAQLGLALLLAAALTLVAPAPAHAGHVINPVASCGLAGGRGTVESWASADTSRTHGSSSWRHVVVTNDTGRVVEVRVRAFVAGAVLTDETQRILPGSAEWFLQPVGWWPKADQPYNRVDVRGTGGKARHYLGVTPGAWSTCSTWRVP